MSADHRLRPFDNVRTHIGLLADVLERADFESLVYLSSTRVYSSSSHGSEDLPVTVNPGDADQLYNLSKLTGEALLASSCRVGLKVARLSNVAGLNPESTTFLASLIQDALAGHICLRSDSLSVRDYIHIDDVTALLTKIATEGNREKYNVASGVNVTNREIVNRLSALTGCTISVEPDAPLHRLPAIDTERIRSEFRIKPIAVIDALPSLVDGYRNW
jgi:nucleoside-diphosphate-sugar epimerase